MEENTKMKKCEFYTMSSAALRCFGRFSQFMRFDYFMKFKPQEIANGNAFPFFALYPDEFPDFQEQLNRTTDGKICHFSQLDELLNLSGIADGWDVVRNVEAHGCGGWFQFVNSLPREAQTNERERKKMGKYIKEAQISTGFVTAYGADAKELKKVKRAAWE